MNIGFSGRLRLYSTSNPTQFVYRNFADFDSPWAAAYATADSFNLRLPAALNYTMLRTCSRASLAETFFCGSNGFLISATAPMTEAPILWPTPNWLYSNGQPPAVIPTYVFIGVLVQL